MALGPGVSLVPEDERALVWFEGELRRRLIQVDEREWLDPAPSNVKELVCYKVSLRSEQHPDIHGWFSFAIPEDEPTLVHWADMVEKALKYRAVEGS